MDKIDLTKKVVKIVVGFSVGYVTSSILKNNVVADTPVQKTQAMIGGYVIGAMVSGAAVNWADEQLTTLIKKWKNESEETPKTV